MQTLCRESDLRTAPNWQKIWKMTMTRQLLNTTSSSKFFDVVLFLLSRLVTGLCFQSVSSLVLELWQFSLIKEFTRNLVIGNTPVWVLPNIWRLEWVMDTKFGTNVSNKMLLNVAKLQSYSFYGFWVIKGKLTGGGGIKLPPPHSD